MIESRLPCAVKGTIPHNGLTVTLRNREMASFLEIVLPGLDAGLLADVPDDEDEWVHA